MALMNVSRCLLSSVEMPALNERVKGIPLLYPSVVTPPPTTLHRSLYVGLYCIVLL
jgi:hypothetical protein